MDYPKVIEVDGVKFTVTSEEEERRWRGQADTPPSIPEQPPAAPIPPGFPPEHQPEPDGDECNDDAPAPHDHGTVEKAPRKPAAKLGTKKK